MDDFQNLPNSAANISIDFLIDLYVYMYKTKINKTLLVIIYTFFRIFSLSR